ncbi:uncharacterized protein LOC121776215 isoform X2 [Salvia splendens]|nr:uncharacterized protein LOC121776215 isoform X2 [Salvia splendens]XP_042029309.1 uncharacterized protein LOC121776215 isoform X2 [Salvia splendens]XP_042029310.1 uncharacterized protein LOC121776215 isoform X2 [Salvia splendens]
MDPKHSGNVLKHLEKQKELLMEVYRSMSHELRGMQVEEEMIMRKYYEFMTAQEKKTSADVKENDNENEEPSEAGALVVASKEEQS